MRTYIHTIVLLALTSLLVGCGSKKGNAEVEPSAPPVPQKDIAQSEESKQEPPKLGLLDYSSVTIPANLDPAKVIMRFMEAMRSGNDLEAAALLTDQARKAATESDMSVKPSASPTSNFQVGKTTYGGAGEIAHVQSSWTESKSYTESVTFNVVWKLRRQQSGWRVAGFAPEVEEGVFTYLDFENPDEMMREYKRAEDRLVEQGAKKQPARNATLPSMGRSLR